MAAFIDVQQNIGTGRRGAIAETNSRVRSCLMTESCLAGLMLVKGATLERTVEGKLPESADELDSQHLLGLGVYQSFRSTDTNGNELLEDRMEAYVEEGAVWCVVENAVDLTDPVYCRHTANGTGKTQLGAFRSDSDGGDTLTITVDTAADNSVYTVEINGKAYKLTSSTSQSTSTIATALASLLDGDADLTAVAAGAVVTVTHDDGVDLDVGAIDPRLSAASGGTCVRVRNARFDSKTSGPGTAKVWVNLPSA